MSKILTTDNCGECPFLVVFVTHGMHAIYNRCFCKKIDMDIEEDLLNDISLQCPLKDFEEVKK